MSTSKKRPYNSNSRKLLAQDTQARILKASKSLFEKKGFEKVTIKEIAEEAQVSEPTIYSLYGSKKGILLVIMDTAFSVEQFEQLVEESRREISPKKRLAISAKIARQMYDAEKKELSLLQGAAILDPDFKALEQEREKRRYDRQKETVVTMSKEGVLLENLARSRDILWAMTGRDLYRLYVIDAGWDPNQYEQWLSETLARLLLK